MESVFRRESVTRFEKARDPVSLSSMKEKETRQGGGACRHKSKEIHATENRELSLSKSQ